MVVVARSSMMAPTVWPSRLKTSGSKGHIHRNPVELVTLNVETEFRSQLDRPDRL